MLIRAAPVEEDTVRFCILCILFLTLLLAPGGQSLAQESEESEAQAQALLDAAVDRLQAADSFKLTITQTGEPYPLSLTFDGVNMLPATLQSAEAQYISPDELHISASVRLFIPLSLDIYSLGDRQWLSFPSGAPWLQQPAFEDFDVNRLLAPGDGIESVMADLQDPRITDDQALINEQPAWKLGARAAGAGVSGLLFGFIEPGDDVELVAYITANDGRFVVLEITMLETVGEPEVEPSVWRIQFSDYDGPRDFEAPSP
ncbi:MAG: LppX_LprAFG lipoprotein [Chloroflexi bacterium]|nr:LppX_LprAFG lipoprotein [Chloroflexota bacterium]